MIYDSLKHLEAYKGIHPGVYRGLELLRDTDFSKLEDGRHEVAGDDLFFLLQSYDTKEVNDSPEAHKKYADIQFLISGQEKIGVGALEDMTELVEARPEGDIWFYHGPVDEITLAGDKFAVLFPGDAHAPCIAVDGAPVPCRKCVVKVRVG
ncbi:YhcH/YjgK/YiaL family protein [Pseudoflavonifractor phocaeensis]|uniref:YhcH/YjgK/YiaL family protein n=1 Tax=Pseudoflavonifractor phocaeensis TaxID=1870988 RepID=UPI001F4079C6|nr:YhcH/YjgK/YiaL family protein [Pseudoflavonifractor phocaeensis]MCF2661913.1 YhcH/YjgK/YiaL family protein [Pseudoflavonifractor phocaeensis]